MTRPLKKAEVLGKQRKTFRFASRNVHKVHREGWASRLQQGN